MIFAIMFPTLTFPFVVSMLIALSVHEWAHGIVAYWLGDPTAKHEGRLTLNPIAHLDPLGTVAFLLIGFGWGKPVPINPRYFRQYRRDTALVSLAGPFSNLCLAFLALLLLRLFFYDGNAPSFQHLLTVSSGGSLSDLFLQILRNSLVLNLALMAFNLLPIAPLDGSKILASFIPLRLEDQYEEYMRRGPLILLSVFLAERLFSLPLLSGWIFAIAESVMQILAFVLRF